MRYFLSLILGLFFIALPVQSSPSEFQFELTGRINLDNNRYFIYLTGKTNLPENSRLDAEVSYLKTVAVPASIREEVGKDYEIEPIELEKGTSEVKNGSYLFQLGYYQRKPYSGQYLAKVRFEPASQTKSIRVLLGGQTAVLESSYEISFGIPADFEKEKEAVKKDIYHDFVLVNKLYLALEDGIAQFILNNSAASNWQKWYQDWQKEVTSLEESNHTRLDQSIYWLEPAGKHTIQLLLEELTRLGREFSDTKKPEPFKTGSAGFRQLLSDKLYELGYQKIIDTAKVTELIASIEKTYYQIKQTVQDNGGQKLAAGRANLELDLFKITQELPEYLFATYLSSLCQDLIDYLSITAQPDESKRNLESKIEDNLKSLKNYLADFK